MANPIKEFAKKFANAYSSEQPKGLKETLKKMLDKIIVWLDITAVIFIIFHIMYLFHCSKPDSGYGTCIQSTQNGQDNSFTYNLKDSVAGGSCSDDIYHDSGQKIDWVDTGFETTGDQLVVYASGQYFPWGQAQAAIEYGNHLVSTQDEDGNFSETLQITEQPKECLLNTSLNYLDSDEEPTKLIYENQLNVYTTWNANNRIQNKSKILIDKLIQADCIDGNNCKLGEGEEMPIGCVLNNGAGIYMRIGNNAEFAYHIINHSVPKLKRNCSGSICHYTYDKTGNVFNMLRIPFGLPTVVWDHNVIKSEFIKDIRGKHQTNLVPITEYTYPTDYAFTTIIRVKPEEDSNATNCVNAGYQKVGEYCYKSITKTFTPEELREHQCVFNSSTEWSMPDELCKPQKGKRIWIKPADTCYDDNEGTITLTFTSGAKNLNPKFQFENNGFRLSWLHQIISVILTPFWGRQIDKEKIEDLVDIERKSLTKQIIVSHSNGGNLHYTKNNGNWMVKLSKYDQSGIVFKDPNGQKTGTLMKASFSGNNTIKSKVVLEMLQSSPTVSDIEEHHVNAATTLLVRISDMNNGLFVKVRNAMMKSSFYHMARIIFVIWFVFSFGLGFINKEKVLTVKLITMDWKRFFILMWFTDPDNYDLLDDMLWPTLFYGSQQVAAGIMDIASAVWGTSLVGEDPMSFFDEIISTLTSKEMIYKLGAVATDITIFYMFFLLFPFFVPYCIDLIFVILGPIISVMFTMFGMGQIIMLMPLYALLSLFGVKSSLFTTTLQKVIGEFVHFAFALGFFGLLVGFVYDYFLDVLNVEICWRKKFSFKLLGIIPLEWGDWVFSGSPGQRMKTIWSMITKTFQLAIVMSVVGKLIKIVPEYLANVFAKGGGEFGLQAAQGISDKLGQIVSGVIDAMHERFKEDEKKEAEKKDGVNDDDVEEAEEGNEEEGQDDKKVKRSGVENDKQNQNGDEKKEENDIKKDKDSKEMEMEPSKNDGKAQEHSNSSTEGDGNYDNKNEEQDGGEESLDDEGEEAGNENEEQDGGEESLDDEGEEAGNENEEENENTQEPELKKPDDPPGSGGSDGSGLPNHSLGGGIGNKKMYSKDDFGINLRNTVLQLEEDEEIIEENVHVHKKKNKSKDDWDVQYKTDAGAMIVDGMADAVVKDSFEEGFVQDGADNAFVQDGADNAFVNADLTGGNSGDVAKEETEQKQKDEQIAQNEKIISKTQMKVKALDTTIEDIDAKILAKLKQINALNKKKFENAQDDKKFQEIIAEKRKEEKKLEILKQQKDRMLGKIKTAKNDNFNLKKE